MFRKNDEHLQAPLFSSVDELPPKLRERLANSWAGAFYEDLFKRIDEAPFAVLYAEVGSRPNVPVNVLIGLEVLKAGRGWTDEEMYDAYCYDMQVRYALGYRNLGEGHFDLRTVYNFRHRLAKHMQKTGENLLEAVFVDVTDEQLQVYKVQSGKLRMDSTQVASNIRQGTRLQLLVEVVQRVQRMLSTADQASHETLFAPYVKGKASHYTYRLKGSYESHIQQVGEVMAQLVKELRADYGQEPVYQMLERVFREHFVWQDGEQRPKQGAELSANSLQSADDWEATYREKQGEGYVGYVANVTETCDPNNEVQLIVHMQTESNVSDDADMLEEALPQLKERLDVKEMHTDGGYNSEDVDKSMRDHQVAHHQTAIRGGKPDPERVGLVEFTIETDDRGRPQRLSCPGGQTIAVEPGYQPQRFIARFAPESCAQCPLRARCRVPSGEPVEKAVLYFDQRQVDVALKRQRLKQNQSSNQNLRPAVESTVRSLKHPFRQGKLPVRGRFRMASMLLGSALMINVRRLHALRRRKKADALELGLIFDHFRRLRRCFRPHSGFQSITAATKCQIIPLPALSYALV